MRNISRVTTGLFVTLAVLTACRVEQPAGSTPSPTDVPTEPAPTAQPSEAEAAAVEEPATPTISEPAEAMDIPTPTPQEVVQTEPPQPQRIEFDSEDGTPLVATYYPPMLGPAPGVLLMHQMRASKDDWQPLIAAMQAPASTVDYAILAIDFPGHGESGGTISDESALAAARAALALLRTLDGADPDRIAMIGASIGADAAVDACGEGCVAAVAVSPGSWLSIPYSVALTTIRDDKDVPVLCIAAANDEPSPTTCRSGETVGLADYQVHIYDGNQHGNALFFEEELTPAPHIIDLVIGWLVDHL